MQYSRCQRNTGNQLTDLHLSSFATVANLYDGQNPQRLDTYRQRAEVLERRFTQEHRMQLVQTLSAYQNATGANVAARRQLEKLRDPQCVAVVTGQQAGLFLGPLFSLYKALSAIGLAARLEEDLHRPVVPIFWIASEDHDFGEVDHAYIIDSNDEVRRLRLAVEPAMYQMVYHQALQARSVNEVLAQANRWLPDTAFKSDCLVQLRNHWQSGMSLSTWFARIFNQLLSEMGLILFDPCLPGLRELAKPVFVESLRQVRSIRRSLDNAYREVQAAGFQPAVLRDLTNSTLFYVQDGKRYVLDADESGEFLTARHLGLRKSASQWIQLAEETPTAFSANVLLRPVVQDTVIPTLCYVGGPSEIAYHPLSAGVFHAHGLTLPPLVLRQRMVLIPPHVTRSMEQYHVSSDIFDAPQKLADRVLANRGGRDIAAWMNRLAHDTDARWQHFADTFRNYGPQIARIAEHQAEKEKTGIRRAQFKTEKLLEQTLNSDVRKLRSVERWLWTDGHQQERRLSLLPLWARYGAAWIRDLPRWSDYQCLGAMYHVKM